MNGRLSSWHRDRALQYYCVCLPVATEEENMLPISAVGLEELVGQPARPTQSASTLCTLRDFFLQSSKLKKIHPKLSLMQLRSAKVFSFFCASIMK